MTSPPLSGQSHLCSDCARPPCGCVSSCAHLVLAPWPCDLTPETKAASLSYPRAAQGLVTPWALPEHLPHTSGQLNVSGQQIPSRGLNDVVRNLSTQQVPLSEEARQLTSDLWPAGAQELTAPMMFGCKKPATERRPSPTAAPHGHVPHHDSTPPTGQEASLYWGRQGTGRTTEGVPH